MRLCFISRALPIHRLGGLELHLRDLAVALASRGHDVTIITTAGGSQDAIAKAPPAAGSPGIGIREIPGSAPGDYSVAFFRHLPVALQQVLKGDQCDCVIPVDLAGLFLPAKINGVAVVPLVHGTLRTEVPLDSRYWAHLKTAEKLRTAWRYKSRLALQVSFERMIRRAPALLVDSEFTRRELALNNTAGRLENSRPESLRQIITKTHVVPLGIDPVRYPAHAGGSKPSEGESWPLRICLLGRLQKIKGLEVAIRAAGQLALRGVHFQMNIGGSGDFSDNARQLVKELSLESQVQLCGRIEPDELGNFFGHHDLFLFPDLTQPAFGLVAVEAMLYGLPVVAARSGAIPEVVSADVGWLYDPWDVSALAALLTQLAADRSLLVEKSVSCAERVRFYTADRMAARTELALEQILGRENQSVSR